MLARIEFEPYEQHKQTTREFSIRWVASSLSWWNVMEGDGN
jgi:hypothetical protein